jgi:NAD(P)-dependent dehydrogenase (short-subunit alcohol dehydrogenase family)
MKSVVVTGASTGIGSACVKILIAGGFRVFGGVRKEADANRLAKEFGANFTPLLFDVTDAAAVAASAGNVRAALGGETLFGLVNNAGIAVPGRCSNSASKISGVRSRSISPASSLSPKPSRRSSASTDR